MTEATLFWICIVVGIIGLISIMGIVCFGAYVWGFYSRRKFPFDHPVIDHFFHYCEKYEWRRDIPRYFADSYCEYLQRRNEFWTSYGQIIIAILIIIMLAILLLTKAISAEAGLPILSGISGFAIAKGVAISKTGIGPGNKEQG